LIVFDIGRSRKTMSQLGKSIDIVKSRFPHSNRYTYGFLDLDAVPSEARSNSPSCVPVAFARSRVSAWASNSSIFSSVRIVASSIANELCGCQAVQDHILEAWENCEGKFLVNLNRESRPRH
jgi:hypothetical protein